MTDPTFLIETSVLTRLRIQEVRLAVDLLLLDGVARSTLSDLELGFSARNTNEWDTIATMLSRFAEVPVTSEAIEVARTVQRELAGRGLKGRKVPDLVIATSAHLAGLEIVHYDRDFDHIAEVTGQATRWIVPPGSVD